MMVLECQAVDLLFMLVGSEELLKCVNHEKDLIEASFRNLIWE